MVVRRLALPLFIFSVVACGGRLAPITEDLPFDPQTRSAGYGFVGGMHVSLVATTPDGERRTLKIDASDLQGAFSVESGGAKVSLTELGPAGETRVLQAVSGTIAIAWVAGPPGSLGSERVQVDVLLPDPSRSSLEWHIAGVYDAEVDYVG
jgi:hypothetical protein